MKLPYGLRVPCRENPLSKRGQSDPLSLPATLVDETGDHVARQDRERTAGRNFDVGVITELVDHDSMPLGLEPPDIWHHQCGVDGEFS